MVHESLLKSPKSRRILVVDRDADSLSILLEPLNWEGYDVRGVNFPWEALKMIENWRPHIVLIDFKRSENSLVFLSQLREKLPLTSCIFISEDSTTEALIEGLDGGADDYIVKPFVPLELLARLRTHLRIRDLNEQLYIANEKLKELVDIDDLTGLYNMRSLYQKLDFEIGRAKRFNRGVSVIMLDMDYFKQVNDGHDHLFGSYVIGEVGRLIKDCTRNIDIPARYGGDEFLVVLTEITHEGAMLFCERIRRSIEKTTFTNGDDSIRLTISIGFSLYEGGDDITSRELVRRADHALYEAKRSGRNRVCVYGENTIAPKFASKDGDKVLPINKAKRKSKSSIGRGKKKAS